jgi:hypothetical protein
VGRKVQWEEAFQEAVFRRCNERIPEDRHWYYIYHVPNGGARDRHTGAALKRAGVKPGVPDIQWDIARHGYHGLRLELKSGKNKTEASQDDWLQFLANEGYCVAIVTDDIEEVMRILEWYLNGDIDDYLEWKESFVAWQTVG